LKDSGYSVLTAPDGGTAVEKVRKERPDLIILDLVFPPDVGHGGGVPWDGFLILTWLNRMDEAKDIPVVILSSSDPTQYWDRAATFGVKTCLRKPVNKDELLGVLSQILSDGKLEMQKAAGKRVLFVDDEGEWREVVSAHLTEAGFEVVTAKDIAETLHRSEKAQLAAIVLDVHLPGENSALLMQLLKLSHPGVPIFIHTGLEQENANVQAMLKQGARQYVRKGTMAELTEAIKQAVN
jgi:two-component system chemotaxis response regulator CheY